MVKAKKKSPAKRKTTKVKRKTKAKAKAKKALPKGNFKRRHRKGPKRALSSYMYFVKLRRSTLADANPHLDNRELVSKLGAMWRVMNTRDKAPFVKLAEKDKKRYEKEKKTWVDPDPEGLLDKRRRRKAPRKPGPKRALSSYMCFVKLYRPTVKRNNPHLENKMIVSRLGALWRGMSASGKKKYEKEAEKDKRRYAREKAAWDKHH